MPDAPSLSPETTAFLAQPRPMLIGDEWVTAADGETLELVNPASGEPIGAVSKASVRELDQAVAVARSAFESRSWRYMPPSERTALIWRLSELIERDAEALVELEVVNQGLPISIARDFVVPASVETLRYNAGWATKMSGLTSQMSLPDHAGPGDVGPSWHAYANMEPVGVVGAIIPWNFPLVMVMAKLAPALAAGCTIIIKPAEEAPLSALKVGELALEAGFPPGTVNILPGTGEEVGAAMAAHPGIDKIAFTGSTETGKKIAQAATGNMKKVSLELGGKSPVLVLDDADIEAAAAAAAEGILFNSGQVCFAGTRVLADAKIFDPLVEAVAEAAGKVKLGDSFDPATELGPLISARQHARVLDFLDPGKLDGVSLATGGKRWGERGYYVEPTIAVADRPDVRLLREEIFGPVLTFQRVSEAADFITQGNDTPYGLAANVWTRDVSKAHRLAGALQAGVVFVNCHSSIDESLPFGGYKQSGWGREGARDGVEAYMQKKSVVVAL